MSAGPAAGPDSAWSNLGGQKSHRMDNDTMIDHIVAQVEEKAEELERDRAAAAAQAAE